MVIIIHVYHGSGGRGWNSISFPEEVVGKMIDEDPDFSAEIGRLSGEMGIGYVMVEDADVKAALAIIERHVQKLSQSAPDSTG
jgi:hypothetical protein